MSGGRNGVANLVQLATSRDVRNLWITGVFTGTNRWTEVLVIGIYTYMQTGSAFIVAIIAFLNTVPGALFGILIGAAGERFDKRTLLLLGYSLLLLIMSVLCYLAFSDQLLLWHLGVGTFLSGAVGTMEYPIRRTLLGEISGLKRASTALTCDVATGKITMFMGPLLGGVLMHNFGLYAFYLMAIGLLTFALLFVSSIKKRPILSSQQTSHFIRSVRDGVTHARYNKPVLSVLFLTIILNFFGYSFISMIPVIGVSKLELDPVSVGLLSSMMGAGALVNLLLLAVFDSSKYFMRFFLGGTLALLFSIILFSVTPWYGLALIVLFAGGLGEAGFSSMQATITFTATAPEIRSRVMGLLVVCIGFGPLGMLHTGFMAHRLGADVAIGIIALEGIIVTLICVWLLPALRRPNIEIYNEGAVLETDKATYKI